MKNSILILGTIIAFIAGSTLLTSCGSKNHQESDSAEQHDMDADHEHKALAETFACSMHPEITGKKGDKCSKCGMALVASTSAKDNMKDMHDGANYSCPMHPEITGKEGEKCSKCGMNLTLAEATEEGDHQHQ